MTTSNTPRVSLKKRLVSVFHRKLGFFEVYSITNKGKVNKIIDPVIAFTDDEKEAFKKFNISLNSFKKIYGLNIYSCKTWAEYVETAWKMAEKGVTA